MSFTINGVSFGSAGLQGPVRTIKSQAVDTFTFHQPLASMYSDPDFAYGATPNIRSGAVKYFAGPVTSLPSFGNGSAEGREFEVSGPWWYLENRPLQQLWNVLGGGSSKLKGRCILGLTLTGTVQNVGEVIASIVQFAIDAGDPVAIGAISVTTPMNPQEVKGLNCAEAIRLLLRAAPDAVAWWDYTASPPSLNVQRASALSPVTVALVGGDGTPAPVRDLRIAPRYDLVRPAVAVRYEITNTVDGVSYPDVAVDIAPEGATGLESGALIETVALKGTDSTYVKQVVKVRGIPFDVSTTPHYRAARLFWGQRIPELRGRVAGMPGDTSVPAISFLYVGDTGQRFVKSLAHIDGTDGGGDYELTNPDDSGSAKIYFDNTLDKALIEGHVMPWMSGVKAQRWAVRMCIAWVDLIDKVSTFRDFTVHLTATDATNRTYASLDSVSGPDPIPEGVAAAIYDAVSRLHYEGSMTIVEPECAIGVTVGKTLNLTGGRSEWTGMNAIIQSVSTDLEKGITAVHFGPPQHLAAQTIVEQQRMSRRAEGNTQRGGTASTVRTSGNL